MQLFQIASLMVLSIGVAQALPIPPISSVADTGDVNDVNNLEKRLNWQENYENQKDLSAQDSVLNRKPRDDEDPCSLTEPDVTVSDDQKGNMRLKVINQKIVKKNNQPEDEFTYAAQIQKRDNYERKLYTFYIGSLFINIIMVVILITTCIKILKIAANKPPKDCELAHRGTGKIGKPCPSKCKKDCPNAKRPADDDDFKDMDPPYEPIKDCTCVTSEARTINFDTEEMNEECDKCDETSPFLKTLEGLTGKVPAEKSSSIKVVKSGKELGGDCVEYNQATKCHSCSKEQHKQEVRPAKSPYVPMEDCRYKFIAQKRVSSWQGYQTNKSSPSMCCVDTDRGLTPTKSDNSTNTGSNTMTRSQIVAQSNIVTRSNNVTRGNIVKSSDSVSRYVTMTDSQTITEGISIPEQITGLEKTMPVVEEESFLSFPDEDSDC